MSARRLRRFKGVKKEKDEGRKRGGKDGQGCIGASKRLEEEEKRMDEGKTDRLRTSTGEWGRVREERV